MIYDMPNVLRQLHNASGLTQEEAVAMIKRRTGEQMHQTAFSSYMTTDTRQRIPSITTTAAIAAAYDVSIEYLLGWVQDRRPVRVLVEKLRAALLPPEIDDAARRLAEMPAEYRAKYVADINFDYRRWQNERRLLAMAKFVPDGEVERIIDAVRAEAGSVSKDDLASGRVVQTTLEMA